MTKPRVGDRIRIAPDTFGDGVGSTPKGVERHERKRYPGTVTYAPENKRWFQVTFDNGIKECFFWC